MKSDALNPASVLIWLLPTRLAACSTPPFDALPDSVPASSVPVSPIVPALATRFVLPVPPSLTTPGRSIVAAVRPTAIGPPDGPIVPLTTSGAVSTIVALVPAVTGPVTVSFTVSCSVKSDALNPASVLIWLVPTRLAACSTPPFDALPDSVPTSSVPVSPIVPALATRFVLPVPPSLTTPGMSIVAAIRPTAIGPPDGPIVPLTTSGAVSTIVALVPAVTGPVTVSFTVSCSVKSDALNPASVLIWLLPTRLAACSTPPFDALPDSVPASSVPVSPIVPALATRFVVPAPPPSL